MRAARLAVAFLAAWAAVAASAPAAGAARRPAEVRTAGEARRPVEVPTVTAGDSDGDGFPEASVSTLAGGPCACRCPVMGGAVGAAAAGETAAADTRTALVVCGTRVSTALDPGPPDLRVPPRLGGTFRFDPGGIGRGGPAG